MKYLIIGLTIGVVLLLGLQAFAQSGGITKLITQSGRLLGIGPGLIVNTDQELEVVFPPPQTVNRVYNESLARPSIDTFTFANAFVAGSEEVKRNGLSVFAGIDYNIVDSTTIQFVPGAGMTPEDTIFASYDQQ